MMQYYATAPAPEPKIPVKPEYWLTEFCPLCNAAIDHGSLPIDHLRHPRFKSGLEDHSRTEFKCPTCGQWISDEDPEDA